MTKQQSEVNEADSVKQTDILEGIPSVNIWKAVFARIKRNKVAVICAQYIFLNLLIAFFYPILMADGPFNLNPQRTRKFGGGANAFPSLRYPAGTDQLGLDSFSRLLGGAETSIMVGVLSTLIAIIIGTVVGLFAGYYQSWFEEVAMRITDFFLAIPFLILALVIVRFIQSSESAFLNSISYVMVITLIIGFFGWAGLTRLVTANTKQVATMEYISAAKVIGVSNIKIIFSHILPNVLAPIVVLAAIFIGGGILSEAGLAFIGFVDPYNTLSWGVSVSLAQPKLIEHPEQALFPGFAIFFLVLSINLLGDTLRDALDPRLKE